MYDWPINLEQAMKIKPIFALLGLGLFLAACDQAAKSAADRPSVRPLSVTDHGGWFEVYMAIDAGAGYDGTAQELHNYDPLGVADPRLNDTLVEFFDNRGTQLDRHTIVAGQHRELVLYPADVQGVPLNQHGYGIMAQNADGSVVSDNPPNIQHQHYLQHGLGGQPVRQGAPIFWSIDARNGRLVITIAGKVVYDEPI